MQQWKMIVSDLWNFILYLLWYEGAQKAIGLFRENGYSTKLRLFDESTLV